MSAFDQRLVRYAGSTVALEFNDPCAAEIIEQIVYPFEGVGPDEPQAILRLEIHPEQAKPYTVSQDGVLNCETENRANVAEWLLSCLCHELAVHSGGGLLFHAAGLAYQGRGILLPGGIGAGKSTFTAWLVAQGCDYLSDELVYIPWETDLLHAFPRPLHLKKPSRPVLSHFLDYQHPRHVLSGNSSDLVHPALLNPRGLYSSPPLCLVLFPRYQPQIEAQWQPLTPAQTGLDLMQSLVNARNLPDHGFSEVARLARSVQAVRIVYAQFEQIQDQIHNLLFAHPQ